MKCFLCSNNRGAAGRFYTNPMNEFTQLSVLMTTCRCCFNYTPSLKPAHEDVTRFKGQRVQGMKQSARSLKLLSKMADFTPPMSPFFSFQLLSDLLLLGSCWARHRTNSCCEAPTLLQQDSDQLQSFSQCHVFLRVGVYFKSHLAASLRHCLYLASSFHGNRLRDVDWAALRSAELTARRWPFITTFMKSDHVTYLKTNN